ncbi:phBC6A51 family helix-turn-helix protein [Staphylococcus chromogenes]|uniref:phBC6A51 family helix-turn-helix protein n=1 Tax=Staphylococcus chromogenes TaxID=46126 RepID=UPI003D7A9143
MNAKQMKAIMLTIEGGLTQKQIAEKLKVTEQTLINWKKKQEYKDELLNAEREMMKGLAVKAIKTMEELLTAKSELVRYNAASDILDRTGHKPTDKVEAEVVTPTIINDVPAHD